MKELIPACTIVLLILLSACSKPGANNTPTGYWLIDSGRFNANYTSRVDSVGYSILYGEGSIPSATQPNVNYIYIWFKTFPVKNGSYQIVPLDTWALPLTENQLFISGITFDRPHDSCIGPWYWDASGFSSIYTWPWTPSDSAQVTVANGKITVNIPETITRFAGPCVEDSIPLTGIIRER